MVTLLLTREDQTRTAVAYLHTARAVCHDTLVALDAAPDDPEAFAFYEMAHARVMVARRLLAVAQRRLRLTCATCLQMSEHNLDTWGCHAHYDLLTAG